MNYRFITCSTFVNTITRNDALFHGKYTVDPYQQCAFGCSYCDSSTQDTVTITSNAVEQFRQEIPHLKKGTIIIGSVHDPYQPAEETYTITRGLLAVIKEYDFPCHILTKSPLILRDFDLLSTMNDCHVTISLVSLSNTTAHIFENNVPSPIDRLHTVQMLSEKGIHVGVALIPVLPYVVDDELENIVRSAAACKAQYVIHKFLDLNGDQKQRFLDILSSNYPQLLQPYTMLYHEDIVPKKTYQSEINQRISKYCKKYHLANTMA
ncbi:MAG: radical SAM protein [Euryarchaeota archaeon]|nr:radical SAM protein [Euryarchaeota archaeon]